MKIENFPEEDTILIVSPEGTQLDDKLETVNKIADNGCDRDVVIDFSRVETLTSSSLCNLIILNKLLSKCGHRLILCNVSLPVKGLFMITGLKGFFEIADDKFAALESIRHTT